LQALIKSRERKEGRSLKKEEKKKRKGKEKKKKEKEKKKKEPFLTFPVSLPSPCLSIQILLDLFFLLSEVLSCNMGSL